MHITKEAEELSEFVVWARSQQDKELREAVDVFAYQLFIFSKMVPGGMEFSYQYNRLRQVIEKLQGLTSGLDKPKLPQYLMEMANQKLDEEALLKLKDLVFAVDDFLEPSLKIMLEKH
ncbi:MAG: hypothetical protein P1P90_02910 [Patescibacteria group bacterium]|nr:hypothetical protein [Patescibacteria group bacterium]